VHVICWYHCLDSWGYPRRRLWRSSQPKDYQKVKFCD